MITISPADLQVSSSSWTLLISPMEVSLYPQKGSEPKLQAIFAELQSVAETIGKVSLCQDDQPYLLIECSNATVVNAVNWLLILIAEKFEITKPDDLSSWTPTDLLHQIIAALKLHVWWKQHDWSSPDQPEQGAPMEE